MYTQYIYHFLVRQLLRLGITASQAGSFVDILLESLEILSCLVYFMADGWNLSAFPCSLFFTK
jgi:hypothetical protein